MSEPEKWMLGCTMIMALCTIGALVVSVIAINRKQDVKVEQPVSVTITEELQDMFAAKNDFEKHCAETRQNFLTRDQQRHEDLRVAAGSRKTIYDKIESSARELRDDLDSKHAINEKRINRSNWMLARLCERNRIPVPEEDAQL